MSEDFQVDPADVARTLRRYATHHTARAWELTHDLGTLRAIRHRGDYSGYDRFDRRLVRASKRAFGAYLRPGGLDRVFGLARDDHRGLGRNPLRHLAQALLHVDATFRAYLRTDAHLPDTVLKGGAIITYWSEDGYYIQMMQRSTGELVADFLEAEPDNPHAIAIAGEISRINADYARRMDEVTANRPVYRPGRRERFYSWALSPKMKASAQG